MSPVIVPFSYASRTVGVFGLARSGLAAVAALGAAGAQVRAWDDTPERVEAVGDAAADLYAADFKTLDALLLSPGVPLTHPAPHPLVKKARAAGVDIISDFDLFEAARPALPAHQVVGITGTNGKSTTTALLAHMLANAGRPAVAAGNIGRAVTALEPLSAPAVYVFEMSSFQLDLTRDLQPQIAILLNITPDHLDRHGSMQGYIAAKARLFALNPGATAIIGVDDAPGQALWQDYPGGRIAISTQRPVAGLFLQGACVMDGLQHPAKALLTLPDTLALRGTHNRQNALAAIAAARQLGLSDTGIEAGLATYPGLAHRQEPVAEIAGVHYINDSKATNTAAALKALGAFERVHWIAGGRAKDDLSANWGSVSAHIKGAYLIGEAAANLAAQLEPYMPARRCGTLAGALTAAQAAAEPGDVILLAPACTAFDQFTDFEDRGNAFRRAVQALARGDQL